MLESHGGRLVAFGYPAIGNDNVITDEKVATEYRQALSDLGVDISLPKSLISKTGGAEFAKRFRCHHTRKDLSPISMRKMTNTHHPHGLYAVLNLYKVKRFSTFCRLAGAGYWTLSRLNKTLSPSPKLSTSDLKRYGINATYLLNYGLGGLDHSILIYVGILLITYVRLLF